MSEGHEATERRARERCEAGDISGAATVLLEDYGPEVLGFLVTMLRDEEDAREVFASFAEQVLKSLPTFAWRSSLRTWAYVVARRTMARHQEERRRRRREVALSDAGLSKVAARVATATLDYLRTAVKDRVAQLRDELDPADQELLILRTSRKLAWADIAEVLAGGGQSPDELARRAVTLRKQFQRVVARLRRRMQEEGLIGE